MIKSVITSAAGFLGLNKFWLIGLTVLGLIIGVLSFQNSNLETRLENAETKLAVATEANEKLAAEVKVLAADIQLRDAVVAEVAAKARTRNARLTENLKEIYNAPPEADGPVPDVVWDTIERLRRERAAD